MDSSKVLEIFKEITRIPRESGKEAPMTSWLQKWAADHGLECKTDAIGNVNIIRPASKGKEKLPGIVLQAHQDMVCEKRAGVQHDFSKDPINYVIEDGWMIAKDTTLGADDGIGIAAALALMESDLELPRIESVFTISEETGMDGAFAMQEGFFTGKTLINLDSEDEGQIFIGCAGGVDTTAEFTYEPQVQNAGWHPVKLDITGGLGGHSGDDINKGRLNTVSAMARFIEQEKEHGMQLIIFMGGGKPNAIARECEAVIAVPTESETVKRFQAWSESLKAEYAESDPNLKFEAGAFRCSEKAICDEVGDKLVHALATCPHGVIAMSNSIPGLVQTSTNLASVHMKTAGKVEVVTSQRSDVPDDLDLIAAKVRKCFDDAGACTCHNGKYPGWTPNTDSHILGICKESYVKLFGRKPLIVAIHAGLECGLFGEKFPGLDMVSFGPTLRGVHTPGERLDLESLDKFVRLLEDVTVNFR